MATGIFGFPGNFTRLISVTIRRRARAPTLRIELRLTKPNTVGFVRFTIRQGRFPAKVEQCSPPGAKRPSRCPS